MNKPQTPENKVVNLSPPQEWLYKCDCPKCISGAHFDKDIAESYRKRGELTNEVARLRGLLKDHATFLRKNGFDRQADDLMRHAPAPEEPVTGLCLICHETQTTCSSGLCEKCYAPDEPVTECQDCGVPLATAEQINKRCSPCMVAKTELLGTTMDEWYGGFSKIESTEPVIQDSRITELQKAISQAINSVSAENGSDTPDFILAEFLTECLMAWNKATRKRNDWHSPEETQDGATMKEWYNGFSKIESTEPANPTCHNTTHKFSHCDCKEPAPEWRELGTDEVIQVGDEWKGKYTGWGAAGEFFLGKLRNEFRTTFFRTRRPLCPNDAPKQEEMPLEDEERPLLKVMEYCRKWADQHLADLDRDHFYARLGLLVDFATDYYSDEIQKLKEAR